jgi:hypothetical protein
VRIVISILFLLMASYLAAQSTDVPLNSTVYPMVDRLDVKGKSGLFTTIKPISRSYISGNLQEIDEKTLDQTDLTFLKNETRGPSDSIAKSGNGLWNQFFRYPPDFFAVHEEDFEMHVNPVIVFGGGKGSETNDLVFENYRGLELRGTIDQKVSFYTLLTENQARYPQYVRNVTDSTLGVPYEGFWKQYQDTGVDFLRARAYIDFNISRHIAAQFGYGKHFIGDGRRSLILSDFGNNYPYLRLNTRIWKLQYTNIFAQLVGETRGGDFGLLGIGSFTRKYLSSHHLSVQVRPNLTIGLFESVMYGDSVNTNLRVEYMNPVIFYRALEQQDGSSDNVIIGADFKWNLWKRVSLYGQLVIDELVIKEAINQSGWWGNKQGFQLGLKYFDVFGVENLNGQLEWNQVRPYVYGHETNFTSYSHYNMALAHPLGANFQEILVSANYKPIPKLRIQADLLHAQYGNDIDGLSYGRDILESYLPSNRPGDFGNDLLQGDQTTLLMIQGLITYQLYHNMQIDLQGTWRNESSQSLAADFNSSVFALTYRWNFPIRSYLF